jgi:hypothetical protein
MFSSQKIILAGNTLHYYQYSKPIEYDFTNATKRYRQRPLEADEAAETASGADSHAYRARKSVRLLLQANGWQWLAEDKPIRPVFVTYTFKECETSLKQANRDFNKFTKRANYEILGTKAAGLKWLTVPEFQKRGAVHYHTIYFNLRQQEFGKFAQVSLSLYQKLNRSWKQGYLFIEQVDTLDHLTNYVSKYFTKTKNDRRFFGEKKYFTARGLLQPKEFRDPGVVKTLLSACDVPHYHKVFESNYISTLYQCYTLPESLKNYSLFEELSWETLLSQGRQLTLPEPQQLTI